MPDFGKMRRIGFSSSLLRWSQKIYSLFFFVILCISFIFHGYCLLFICSFFFYLVFTPCSTISAVRIPMQCFHHNSIFIFRLLNVQKHHSYWIHLHMSFILSSVYKDYFVKHPFERKYNVKASSGMVHHSYNTDSSILMQQFGTVDICYFDTSNFVKVCNWTRSFFGVCSKQ